MKKVLLMMVFLAASAVLRAQTLPPNLALGEIPSKPLTVIFKDMTRGDLFRLVERTLKENQKVKPFIMRRAQRGLIEYEGLYSGEKSELIDLLAQAVSGKVSLRSQSKGEEGLEILITPYGS